MKSKLPLASLLLFLSLCSIIKMEAQRISPEEPWNELWTPLDQAFSRISIIPSFPYADGWPGHFCYLGRTHSAFYNNESKKLLLTYESNSTEFFHAAGSDFIYIPRVLTLDVPEELK